MSARISAGCPLLPLRWGSVLYRADLSGSGAKTQWKHSFGEHRPKVWATSMALRGDPEGSTGTGEVEADTSIGNAKSREEPRATAENLNDRHCKK